MAKKTSSKSRSDERKATSSDAEDGVILPDAEDDMKTDMSEEMQVSPDDADPEVEADTQDGEAEVEIAEIEEQPLEDSFAEDAEPVEIDDISDVEDLEADVSEAIATHDDLDIEAEEPEEDEAVTATSVPPVTPRAPEPAPERQSGFPLVLGGLLAGAIGFGAAYFLPQTDAPEGPTTPELKQQLDRETRRLSDVSDLLEALQKSVSAAPDPTAEVTGLSDRIAALEGAVSQLEDTVSRASGNGGGVPADVQDTLNDLRAALAAQQDIVSQLEADAQLVKDNARNAANATLQRAALSRLMTALESGTAFSDAVTDLEGLGVTVPGALSQNANSGIASLSALQAQFPDAARAALSAAREAGGADGSVTSLTAFMRKQLGVRSLEPQEGDSVDAILSRVEAATREGHLQEALNEMSNLPDPARSPMEAWGAAVENRLTALDAAQTLSDSLN